MADRWKHSRNDALPTIGKIPLDWVYETRIPVFKVQPQGVGPASSCGDNRAVPYGFGDVTLNANRGFVELVIALSRNAPLQLKTLARDFPLFLGMNHQHSQVRQKLKLLRGAVA